MGSKIKVVMFDCFGTVFDVSSLPREFVRRYADRRQEPVYQHHDFEKAWYELKSHPDSRQGIAMLRDEYRVVTMSNGSFHLLDQISSKAGIVWDLITPIELLKVYKPDHAAYLAIPSLFQCQVDECLMVTANPTFGDVKACTEIGMPYAIIRQPNCPKTIPDLAWALRGV